MSDSFPIRPVQRRELQAFLVGRRRQLAPLDRGRSARNGSRRGLSQADVAELAGVSLNWYEQFESGRNDRRVSVAFIERVAAALGLDEPDKLEFFRLAAPENAALASVMRSTEDGALAAMRSIRRLVRRVSSANDLCEIAGVVAETMQEYARTDSATLATLKGSSSVTGFAVGPRARYVGDAIHLLKWQTFKELPLDRVGIVAAGATLEELMQRPIALAVEAVGTRYMKRLRDLRFTPELYQATGYRVRAVTSLSLPLAEGRRLGGLVTIFWTRARRYSRFEIETATTVTAIVQLITA